MRRDDDYMREIMLKLEASDDWLHPFALHELIPGTAPNAREYYHMRYLVDSGFLEVQGAGGFVRITNAGHDFCASTRTNEAWEATKNAARQVGGGSLRFFLKAAEMIALEKLRDLTGVDL